MAVITAAFVGVVVGGTFLITSPKHVAPVVAATEDVVIAEPEVETAPVVIHTVPTVPSVVVKKTVQRAAPKKVQPHRVVVRQAPAPVAASPIEHCNWLRRCVEIDPVTGLVTKEPGYLAK